MLYLKIPEMRFNDHVLVRNAELKALKGEMTVISGESGSGKTTIIQSILCENSFASVYQLDGENIVDGNQEDIQMYKRNCLSVVSQNPSFIDTLTVQQHLKIYRQFSEMESEVIKKYIHILKVEDCLKKYPNELSGGERSRVSLLLALIKDREVLVLDEPTSSLDLNITLDIIKILKDIKKNKIVIVSTHDDEIIRMGDKVYSIENQQLLLKKESRNDEKECEGHHHFNDDHVVEEISRVFKKSKKKRYQKVFAFMSAIMIAFASFATCFSNAIKKENTKVLKATSNTELYICKPSGGYTQYGSAGDSDDDEIIYDDEIEKIRNIDFVEEVRSRMDISIGDFEQMVENYDPYGDLKMKMILTDKDGNTTDKSYSLYDEVPTLNSYYSDKNYDREILVQFDNKGGIYITKRLAEYLCDETTDFDKLNGMNLTFSFYTPVYNSVGKAWSFSPDGKDIFWPPFVSCIVEDVTLPISGVLKTGHMGIPNYMNFEIFIDNDFIFNMIEKHKRSQGRTSYILETDDYEYAVGEIPEGKKVRREVKEEVWTPKSYSVFVSDASKLETVAKEISELGFNVCSEHLDYMAADKALDRMHQGMVVPVCYSLSLFVIMIYVVIKFNNRREERNIIKYFYDMGLDKRDIHQINHSRYLRNMRDIIFCSIVSLFGIVAIFNAIRYGYTTIDVKMIAFALGTSIIIEYVYPFMMERKIMNDFS